MATEIAPPDPNSRKRRRDFGALWRAGAWGGAAVIALAALAITTQTDSGSERLQFALAGESPPPAVTAAVPPPAAANDAETKRLQAEVLTLAADRDRLNARIASLEQNLDDVTGSIRKQAALASAAPADKPATPAQPALPAIAPLAMHVTKDTAAPWPGAAPVQAATAAPAQSETPAAEAVPLPPTRVASVTEPAVEPRRKPEIGVDLGGARNLDVLNARWAALKANFGPLLNGLHPLAARDLRPGMAEYRLLVGPLPTHAAAAQLCARFAAVRVTCRSTKFDGERMAQR